MTRLLTSLIRAYQRALSPILHALCGPLAGCRFEPSCSEYCLQALDQHGPLRGLALGARRICRCNPWGPAGLDPVPPAPSTRRPITTQLYGQNK